MSRVDNVERQSAHNWPHMFYKVCRAVSHKAARERHATAPNPADPLTRKTPLDLSA